MCYRKSLHYKLRTKIILVFLRQWMRIQPIPLPSPLMYPSISHHLSLSLSLFFSCGNSCNVPLFEDSSVDVKLGENSPSLMFYRSAKEMRKSWYISCKSFSMFHNVPSRVFYNFHFSGVSSYHEMKSRFSQFSLDIVRCIVYILPSQIAHSPAHQQAKKGYLNCLVWLNEMRVSDEYSSTYYILCSLSMGTTSLHLTKVETII